MSEPAASQSQSLTHILATRYMAAAGLVVLLYDHLDTLPEEVRLIWPAAWEYSKIAFLYNRYAVTGYLLYVAYVLSGISGGLTSPFCRGYIVFISIFAAVSMAMANVIMLFRVYALYDHRRRVMAFLITGFGITYAMILVFGVITIQSLFHQIAPDNLVFRTCVIQKKPEALNGVWSSMVLFDVYVFILTLWNAADRPQQVQLELVSILKRDGILFFIILFCLRLLNLIISIAAGPDLMFLGVYFVQAMVSLTLSRLLLQVENMRMRAGIIALVDMSDLELPPATFAPRSLELPPRLL